ncbi:MAG: PrgI family protein [Candidatus Hadarchaeum sp.]
MTEGGKRMRSYKTPLPLTGEIKIIGGRLSQKQALFLYGGLFLGLGIAFILPAKIKLLGIPLAGLMAAAGYFISTAKVTKHKLVLADYLLLKFLYYMRSRGYVWRRKGVDII